MIEYKRLTERHENGYAMRTLDYLYIISGFAM